MGVGKNSAPFCQRIHMRRDRVRVASEESNPVVEIVDANHQDVGFIGRFGTLANCDYLKRQSDHHAGGDYFIHSVLHSKDKSPPNITGDTRYFIHGS
jgi:hypothetical protein